ncbi:MAG: hypothetical protein A6F71_09700 [Cycloclasticus sp. symbiont of Poecilosclerida sp. M]|nr:MAG: hypothetical protein A6F71_09700 [Cycloclasticus sp. symbiont of Poecilosclerida sp. M]
MMLLPQSQPFLVLQLCLLTYLEVHDSIISDRTTSIVTSFWYVVAVVFRNQESIAGFVSLYVMYFYIFIEFLFLALGRSQVYISPCSSAVELGKRSFITLQFLCLEAQIVMETQICMPRS